MLKTDRDALLCDLAETYGIFDMGSLPVKTVAALAFGLREDSRIKMKMTGTKVTVDTYLLAVIADSVNFIRWSKTQAALDHPNKPPARFLNDLLGIPQQGDGETCKGFRTAEEFESAYRKILRS